MRDLLARTQPDLRERWNRLTLGYTESAGLPELREAVAATYETVASSETLVAAPEELVFLAMNAILRPGDRVVCTYPGYQSLYQLALTLGCDVVFWEPTEREEWRFEPKALDRLLVPGTRMVVWNFPHNPTGALPSQEEYTRMLDLVRQSGAWLFSDEMYRLLELSSEQRLPAAVDRYERALSLSGMSKAYGLAGLRLGWVATHDGELLQRMAGLKDYTTICSAAPSELLALMALRDPGPILDLHRRRVAANIETAEAFFAGHGETVRWIPPRAGTVCFPRLVDGVPLAGSPGAKAFCETILRDTGALLLPSTVYGYGDSHFRMGLGRTDFAAGLEVVENYLDTRTR
jgi:aspartate/methionine/tyrosine aminotransferase